MNKIKLLSIPILCLSFLSGCQDEIKADMVVFGDQIYTANKKGEFADAFAIKDGKYIYVGNVSGVDKYIGKNTSVYYLPFVMPSGIESHAHFILEQAFLETCYINPKKEDNTNKTKKEILDFIEQYALNNCNPLDPEDCLFGYGYDQLPFMKQGIDYTREDLDRLADGYLGVIPVYIAETSLHQAWVNTLTLQRAGIKIKLDKNETDPVSGILRDENGYATGVIINEACAYVLSKGYRYPILNEIGYQRVIKNTCSYLNEMGYTGHYDAWSNFDGTDSIYKALFELDQNNELTCFYTSSYNITTYEYKEVNSNVDTILDKICDIRNKYKGKHVDPKYIKLFSDGVLETLTGYLKEPYLGLDDYYGEQIWQQDDMNKIVAKANQRDILVHTHTLGDASCSEAIQSYIYSNNVNGKKTRNSLGHCILVDEADYPLIKENNIGLAINAGWLDVNGEGFDLYDVIIGGERAKNLYPSDKLLKNGINPAISTDRPCASGPVNIFDYMASIILGYDANLNNQVPRRKIDISVKQAIEMLTINGAWMANYENERGSIEVGKYADFIAADYSPFDCNPKIIKDIEVVSTCFEGQFVYINTKL